MKYDIAIIGDLVGVDILFAEMLSRKGFNCLVVRKKDNKTRQISDFSFEIDFSPLKKNLVYYNNPLHLLKLLKNSKLIVSFSGTIVVALREFWLFRYFLKLPPVVNITTGSDITELINEKSLLSMMYRQYLHFVKLNWCVNYPHAIKNLVNNKIPNVVFMRFPYYLPKERNINVARSEDTILFFNPSHIDFGITDNKADRNSTKGTDRFFRAFIRAINEGYNYKCILLERGPDVEIAKGIIKEHNAEQYFFWKPHMTRDDFYNEIAKSDIIVDQFDVGGFGGIAIESMSMGKPVMTYIHEACHSLSFIGSPPILNCHSEDEIYEQIIRCNDLDFLTEIGEKSRRWVLENFDSEHVLNEFIFYYMLLTGDTGKNIFYIK